MGIIQNIERKFMGQAPEQPIQQPVMVTEEVPATPAAPTMPTPPQAPVIGDSMQVEARPTLTVVDLEPRLVEDRSAFNCPNCGGSGLDASEQTCQTCKGTGKV